GGGLAGWRAAEALRRHGHTGRTTLVGGEAHPPYDRPPLSKDVLRGDTPPERVTLAGSDELAAAVDDVRLGVPATGLTVDRTPEGEPGRAHVVTLADGTELRADGVVVATGASARHLPGTEGVDGVFTLRTLDDSL